MKNLFLIAILLFLTSCKSKKILAESAANSIAVNAEKIIENHYNNKIDFSTLYIKANAKYEDSKNTQNVTADIKIKKDEKIAISIRFLGITMAKALITPTKVEYYEKINSTFFEGDYALLSRWLGTDLDYQKVQNLFLGKPIDDLTKDTYSATISNNLYQLENNKNNLLKHFLFEAENYLLKKQEVIQASKERNLQINYPEYNKVDQTILPLNFGIIATQPKDKVTIDINYKNITFNEELSFPYSVPEGFEQIFIK